MTNRKGVAPTETAKDNRRNFVVNPLPDGKPVESFDMPTNVVLASHQKD